jgi:hypothetical protein
MNTVPESWRPIERELRTYLRIAPKLIAEGKAGQYVVIRDDQPISTWKTYAEASRYGHQTYDDGRFLVQPVDPSSLTALISYLGATESAHAGAA